MTWRTLAVTASIIAASACMAPEPTEPAAPEPVATETQAPSDECGAANAQGFVGQQGSEDLQSEIEALAVGRFRWIPHGSAVTMDYRPTRLNVELDEDGAIARIACY